MCLLEGLHYFSFPEDRHALCHMLLALDGLPIVGKNLEQNGAALVTKGLMQESSDLAGLSKLTWKG